MTFFPHLAAALLGVILARRDPTYRSIGRSLAILFAVRLAREGCRLLRPDAADRIAAYVAGNPVPPYEGLARASWAAEQALTVAWYAVLAWAIWDALRPAPLPSRASHRVGCAALLVFLAAEFFAVYPSVRGRPFEVAMVFVFFTSLAVQGFAFAEHVLTWRRPNAARFVALLLAAGSVADAFGQWVQGQPIRDSGAAGPAGVLVWTLIAGVELWAIAAANNGRLSRS